VPIVGRTGDEEGTAKGAALLAGYMVQIQSGNSSQTLAEFAKSQTTGEEQVWEPDAQKAKQYDARYEQFAAGVKEMQG
jgi:sugar (pentulose or hexulose) kinase